MDRIYSKSGQQPSQFIWFGASLLNRLFLKIRNAGLKGGKSLSAEEPSAGHRWHLGQGTWSFCYPWERVCSRVRPKGIAVRALTPCTYTACTAYSDFFGMPADGCFTFLASLVAARHFGIVYYMKNTAELSNCFY